MKIVPNSTIWIEDDKIINVCQNGEELKESTVIDANGCYVMPGLVNLHVHLASSGKPPKTDKPTDYKGLANKLLKIKLVCDVYKKLEEGFAKQELYSGVTTLRAVGGLKDFDGFVRDKINSGKIIGPRILCANTAISVPGGHFAGSLATETTSPETAIQDVINIKKTNPDLIKLMITGGVMDASEKGEPGALRMKGEIVKAACDKAHEYGLKVAAHVESTEGVRVACENGVDTIEHGAKLDKELIALLKEKHTVIVTTLSPALPYALFDSAVSHVNETGKANGTIVFNGIVECAKQCLENGIPIGLGTDTGCPFITHYNSWREIEYAKKYLGISAEKALHLMTLNNAKIAQIDKITGSIEKGKCADIIICKNNPLESFSALKELEYVFARGKMIKNPKIKKMKDVDIELDKFM